MSAAEQPASFVVGDLVALKSGSAYMTVESSEPAAAVKCVWFNDAMSRFDRETFQPGALRCVAKPEPEPSPKPEQPAEGAPADPPESDAGT